MGITAPLRLMQSNGGLASAGTAAQTPAKIVESGPAAGVVGAAILSARLGEARVITFDMGGTTAKAGLVEGGEVTRTAAMEIGAGVMAGARLLVGGGYMLKLPAIDLAEVGAGGGSLCRIDAGGGPKVGPQSAGADPGPVCYGRGGTVPTVTDCNLVLGYLDPAGLAGGAIRLDVAAARSAIADHLAGPMNLSVEQAALGMLKVAAATMMRAIRTVSVERGIDVRSCAMMAFGGNGPLFAAGIARELGITRIIVPPMPGVFSAFGLLLADTEHHLTRSLRARLGQLTPARLQSVLDGLHGEGDQLLAQDGFPPHQRQASTTAMARYIGQSSEIAVPLAPGTAGQIIERLPEAFGAEHQRLYGFRAPPGEPVELTGLAVLARGVSATARLPDHIPPAVAQPDFQRQAWFEGEGWMTTPVIGRAALPASGRPGPLIIQEYDATCLVPPGVIAAIDTFGNIRLTV
jgi:N-methylhydantoinase A